MGFDPILPTVYIVLNSTISCKNKPIKSNSLCVMCWLVNNYIKAQWTYHLYCERNHIRYCIVSKSFAIKKLWQILWMAFNLAKFFFGNYFKWSHEVLNQPLETNHIKLFIEETNELLSCYLQRRIITQSSHNRFIAIL